MNRICFVFFLTLTSCLTAPQAPEAPSDVQSKNTDPDQLLEFPQLTRGETVRVVEGFALSFSSEHKLARWVAYSLMLEELVDGDAERKDNFHADSKVEGSANPSDYARTGYDRGHLAPAADMQWSERAMDDSFLMSNMAPQKPRLNRGIWKKLETKTRDWARAYKEVWITTGPVLTAKLPKLKRSGVSIPEKFFKVVLDSRCAQPKAIAFVIPQEFNSKELCDFAISVDEAEKVVGLDFFPALDDDTENEVEARVDCVEWMRVGE